MPPSTQEILHSYRHIYRTSLHAIQYSSPSRHVLRKLINNAYRTTSDFHPQKIANTLTFLEGAAKARGLEHRIVKTLMHSWYYGGQTKSMKLDPRAWKSGEQELQRSAFEHFEATLKMLNESMGMCLPTAARATYRDALMELDWATD